MATATASRISRETLEDRYQGLMFIGTGEPPLENWDWAKPQQRLSAALTDIVGNVARCHYDDVGQINDELRDIIREHVIRRIDELGLAR
jgi:hypothetical protein